MIPFDQAFENAPREKLRDVPWQTLQELLRLVSGRNRFYTEKWRETGARTADPLASAEQGIVF